MSEESDGAHAIDALGRSEKDSMPEKLTQTSTIGTINEESEGSIGSAPPRQLQGDSDENGDSVSENSNDPDADLVELEEEADLTLSRRSTNTHRPSGSRHHVLTRRRRGGGS